MRTLLFSLFVLVPACAASESVPLSDIGADADVDSRSVVEDSAAFDSAMDTTLADADSGAVDTTVDTTAMEVPPDTEQPDTEQPDTGKPDTGKPDTGKPDTGIADVGTDSGFKSADHRHIYISNTCKVTVSPTSFTVPAGETLRLSYHNHSVDYRADVWMMYGGGYLGLEKGATWNETYAHCFGPSPSAGYADITIEGGAVSGCPGVRLPITCQ